MLDRKLGGLGLVLALAVISGLPTPSQGRGEVAALTDGLRQTTEQITADIDRVVEQTATKTRAEVTRTAKAVQQSSAPLRATTRPAGQQTRVPTPTPETDPPLHGTNNHGQGTVGVVDLAPSNERPQGGDPDGSDAGEEIVAGRARGEQQSDGNYHGHITIAALFGNEVAGVDTTEGQTNNGPLQPVQENVLDPLCNGSAQQICLSVLTANSSTTDNGSTNDFAVARAQLGGSSGLGVGAAESQGTISQDADCQTSSGSAKTANVTAGGGAVANVANSSSTSKSCRGQQSQVTNSSQVIGLGGTNVPIPAPGCADGTPDTVTGIPTLAPIVCHADTVAGATGVREALGVFVLSVGGTSLTKETTAASESVSTAPPESGGPACSDRTDNDGDGLIDAADPGCHTDGNASNPSSYNPNDTSEADRAPTSGAGSPTGGENGRAQCSDNRDNDGDGRIDERDPGCHTDGNANNPASYQPDDDSEADGSGNRDVTGRGSTQCSDGTDNDGDGVIDSRDPGCHSDGDAGNPASYVPGDDSEADSRNIAAGRLPFTGVDVVGLVLAGLLLLLGGLLLRREGTQPSR